MDNEGLPYGYSGEVLQSFPTFFTFFVQEVANLVNNLNLNRVFLGNAEPSMSGPLESVIPPAKLFPGSFEPGNSGAKGLVCDSFNLGKGLESEYLDFHNNNVITNIVDNANFGVDVSHKKLVDTTTTLLHNNQVSRKGEAPGTVTPEASLLTLKIVVEVGAKDMLHPSQGSYQHAQVFFPLTTFSAGAPNSQPIPLTRPGSFSLSCEDLCPFCEGRAVWEEASETWGDIIHQEHVCSECNGTGLSLLGLIESGLAGEPERYPAELEALEA